jgi:hypothetical protein
MRADFLLRASKLRRYGRPGLVGVAIASVLVVLALGALAGCNSTPTETHAPTSANTGPTATGQTAAGPTSTAGPLPTATPNPTVLQVDFTEQYTAAPCTGTSASGTTCVTTTGTGQDAAHGSISLSRSSVYAAPAADYCSSATTQGRLTLASTGDTITFTGTGNFCRATQVANFTYTITGGTGAYAHATGSGSIHVPLPTSSSTGTETWTGSILTH